MALLTVTSEALFPVFTLYTIAFWHDKGILSRESGYICKTVKSSGKIGGRNEDFSDIYISIMSFYRIWKIKLIVRRKATKNQKRNKGVTLKQMNAQRSMNRRTKIWGITCIPWLYNQLSRWYSLEVFTVISLKD